MWGTVVHHCKPATWGKSLDDVSGILGGTGSTCAVTLFSQQDPFDTQAERGPSSFDVTQAFTLSAARAFGTLVGSNQAVDQGLGVAEHVDDHQWFAVYGVFGNPADGRGNDWRGPTQSFRIDLDPRNRLANSPELPDPLSHCRWLASQAITRWQKSS
jgi:hypothetical protein